MTGFAMLWAMQIDAYLSRPQLEQGAALTISGNRITTSDTLAVVLTSKRTVNAAVSAFGIGRLVLAVGRKRYELQPWLRGHDEPPEAPITPVSRWTIRSVREAG